MAYFRSEDSASPDTELYTALEPAMATFGNAAMMIGISSPYRRAGPLFEKWKASYGKPDPEVLVVRGPSRVFNPSLSQKIVDDRLARDPEAGAAEYLAEWRNDLSDFLDRELVEDAVDAGVKVRPPHPKREYMAFTDVSGGRGDSFTAAIAHNEDGTAVLDALYERRAPFNPSEVVRELADLLRQYSLTRICGDKYAAGWKTEAFAEAGISYDESERDRSAIYLDVLPLFTSGRIRLLDNPRLVHQFVSLERRQTRFGKDRVDHPQHGGADDLCNAAAGAAVLVVTDRRGAIIKTADLLTADLPDAILHPHGFICTIWVTPDGQCAIALFSHEILANGGGRMVLEWFDTSPWTSGLLLGAARRMDELCEAAFARSDRVKERGGCAALLMVQQQLMQPATIAMQTVFAAKLEAEYHRRGGVTRNVNAVPIAPAYTRDPARLILGAAGHVAAGSVKMSAAALATAEGKPLLGSLSLKPGEAVETDPLRVALLVGIAQLDPEWDDEGGAQVRFG